MATIAISQLLYPHQPQKIYTVPTGNFAVADMRFVNAGGYEPKVKLYVNKGASPIHLIEPGFRLPPGGVCANDGFPLVEGESIWAEVDDDYIYFHMRGHVETGKETISIQKKTPKLLEDEAPVHHKIYTVPTGKVLTADIRCVNASGFPAVFEVSINPGSDYSCPFEPSGKATPSPGVILNEVVTIKAGESVWFHSDQEAFFDMRGFLENEK